MNPKYVITEEVDSRFRVESADGSFVGSFPTAEAAAEFIAPTSFWEWFVIIPMMLIGIVVELGAVAEELLFCDLPIWICAAFESIKPVSFNFWRKRYGK